MSLSTSFNLESLNLDIESYTKDELVQMFRLPNNYTTEMVKKNKNNLQDKINKLSIESSKKYSYLLFVDNAEKKLVDSFNGSSDNKSIVNMELSTNKVSNYDSNFVIENKSIVYNSLKDVTNEIKKEKNMNYIKYELLNPLIEHVVKELYPYFLKIIIVIVVLFILIIFIIVLNLRIIYK